MFIKRNALATAIGVACVAISGNSFAAALDRSGQSIAPFLQSGNYAEISGSSLHPDVEGTDRSGNATGDMATSYNFMGAAIKLQPLDNVSVGLIFDEPFGASAAYNKGNSNFVSKPTDQVLTGLPVVAGSSIINNGQLAAFGVNAKLNGHTEVEVKSRNLSGIVGVQPIKNLNLYAGAVYQEVEGHLKLRGSVYSLFNGYDAYIPTEGDWGWLAGAAYEIPEIALKASLTYRSEIDYDINVQESMPLVGALAANSQQLGVLLQTLAATGQISPARAQQIGAALGGLAGGFSKGATKVTTPQSVNLDFQTGIMADTVAFANLRWVEWSKFAIRPYQFAQLAEKVGPLIGKPNGFNLVDYYDDQWSANLGIGRKLTDTIGGSVSVGWDSGAGNPVTTLGPTEGYWNVGLGLRYSPAPQVELSGGVKYFWLGDAKAETGAHSYAGDFEGNDALAFGLKLGYRF